MPPELKDQYLLHGAVQVLDWYFSEVAADTGVGAHVTWSQQYLDSMTAQAKGRPSSFGNYQEHVVSMYHALDCHPVTGLYGAVIGTQFPWLEAVLLAFGASKLTTVEYAKIDSQVKNVEAITPREWSEKWLDRTLPKPDFVATFSSLEHDGLARYGDPLNPWGDAESMQRLSCYLKPGGLLFLNVPTHSTDTLVWNAHRSYGPIRYPLLTANWKVLSVFTKDKEMSGCAGNCANFWDYVKRIATDPHTVMAVVVLQNQQLSDCQES
eukprot:gene8065-8260_t